MATNFDTNSIKTKKNKSFFNNLGDAIRNLFRSKKNTIENSTQEENKNNNEAKDLFINAPIEEITKITQENNDSFAGMPDDLKNKVIKLMRQFWYLGNDDGSIGQRQMPKGFFRTFAEHVRDDFKTFIESRLNNLKIKSKTRGEVVERRQEVLKIAEEYRDDIAIRRQLYPQSYALWLAIIYIIVALLLLFADVPLALLVTQNAFDFELAQDGVHTINNIFARQIECSEYSESWLQHVWLVLTNNWQVFFMTFGVALCTFYFKIFYDDFMGYPMDKAVRQFRLLSVNRLNVGKAKGNLPEGNGQDIFTSQEEKELKAKYMFRLGVKTLILVFTVSTIVVLGLLRAEQSKHSDYSQESISEKYEETLSFLNNSDITSIDTSNLVQPSSSNTSVSSNNSDQKLVNIKKWVYILLTILFPVIAGICLSLGFGSLHNVKEIKFAEKHFLEKQDEHILAMEEFEEIDIKQKYYESRLEGCTDVFVDNYEAFFYNCYLHGYQRGVVQPDKDYDFYERAKRLRDRLISTKSAEAIQKANKTVESIIPFNKKEI